MSLVYNLQLNSIQLLKRRFLNHLSYSSKPFFEILGSSFGMSDWFFERSAFFNPIFLMGI